MICYASRTGTRRNLAALRQERWRLIISREGVWRSEGFPYALDNGAWTDFQRGRDFDNEKFRRLVDEFGSHADWIIAPDIVAGGVRSLRLSMLWLPHLLLRCRLVLIAVQDGMTPADLAAIVMPKRIGIFLGGSTDWKVANMRCWGEFCAEHGVYYHVGRVNSVKRIALACFAGADSIDGTSATRFAVTLPKLSYAARQWDMWEPPKSRDEQYLWATSA